MLWDTVRVRRRERVRDDEVVQRGGHRLRALTGVIYRRK